ncbi:MAG: contractile injection system protein, VgrG/Pvc8 family [Acetatifactor sp.]
MDAITYGQLILMLGETPMPVFQLVITEEQGCHGKLSATVAVEEGVKDYLLYEENGNVALYVIQGKTLNPIFFGILTSMSVKASGKQCMVCLEAVTGSYQMDLFAQNCSFQDTALTSHQLVKKVMKPYKEQSKVLFSIPNEELGQIMVQYQETDWAFLNRILSRYGVSAYVDSSKPGICLRAGLMDTEEDADWDHLPYEVVRNTAPADTGKRLKGQLCYKVEAYEIFPLGEKVHFHNQDLYIGRIERSICQGLLVNYYSLYFQEGLAVSRYNNPFLSGVSINGTVAGVKRNKLQVKLVTDALTKCKKQHFFPFSTVAASPDGSGWYCMPKEGDRIRIFFPTDDEKEGYAIANILGNSSPTQGSSMENPDAKDITTPDGKSVRFIPGGIQLAVGEDKGTVTLTNDGKAEIRTDEDIIIGAAEAVCITTEGTMEISAGTQIQIISDAGGSICMTSDTVEIQASVIENN